MNLLTNNKRVYTVEEIQAILGVSKNTTYALVKSGVFHSVKVGGQYRISKKSFDEWLDNIGIAQMFVKCVTNKIASLTKPFFSSMINPS